VPAADLVITGTILTVNPGQPTAEAVAVSGGRIAAANEVVARGAADPRSVHTG
jgi:predicted amidohydrolase YtcJ